VGFNAYVQDQSIKCIFSSLHFLFFSSPSMPFQSSLEALLVNDSPEPSLDLEASLFL